MIYRNLHVDDVSEVAGSATEERVDPVRWLPAVVLAVSAAYAVLRYVIVKEVAVAHVPLYIANKAFAVAGVLLLAITAVARGLARRWGADGRALCKRVGANACLLIGLHVVISALILRPSYFAAFFTADGAMTGRTELAMLLGVGAGLAMASLAAPGWRASLGGLWSNAAFACSAALWFAALHVFAMGVPGWLDPSRWPGYLPPLTLLSFLAVVAAIVAKRVAAARGSDAPPRSPPPG